MMERFFPPPPIISPKSDFQQPKVYLQFVDLARVVVVVKIVVGVEMIVVVEQIVAVTVNIVVAIACIVGYAFVVLDFGILVEVYQRVC